MAAVLGCTAVVGNAASTRSDRTVTDQQARLERQADALEAAAKSAVDEKIARASSAEVSVACDLAVRFHEDSRTGRGDRERFRGVRWKALPKVARCGGDSIVFQPAGFGKFVTDIAPVEGGRYWAVRGGWQMAPLVGAGSDCLYEKRDGRWHNVMCIGTWVS
ncbi:hypothetical protein [uncultured Sphingomonas sp.]|uniref:hypothetical protein n=1 Tax=uncultured Sphingomonas sp. TaxID=158754 RepID=UPI0025FCE7F9|nr:hypothetical protein [uncultured Sphingomonas sp.]